MTGFVNALLSDLLTSLAFVVGGPTIGTTLILVGAATIAAVTVMLLSRAGTTVPAARPGPVSRVPGAPDVTPLVPQRDPDAAGRVRPRAPGAVLG